MQTILIVDDDRAITEALADGLEQPGRELILCSDLESAQLVIERIPLECVITDVRLTGPFRFEGLDFISHIKRHAPGSRIIVMTGARAEGLEREALERGADAVQQKPFGLEELEGQLPMKPAFGGPPSVVRIPAIDDVIESGQLVPSFQPIVDLSTTHPHTVHGYESLARFYGLFFSDPNILFEYAARKGRVVDLELACIRSTFAHGAVLPVTAKLFINVHPSLFADERLADALTAAEATVGVAAERIVLEITEQSSLGDSAVVERQCGELRRRGFSFALDDVGMAYSHLTHIEQIRPAYLKVSQDFGTDFERAAARTKIVRNVLALARDFGCELILEGIESAQTRDAARALGIRLGQGFFFARPAQASQFLGAAEAAGTRRPDARS
ncbi:MAG: EAL domain-containing response regulator [Thermoanaerobaculia bacterium]|jgi:EAL domain-containing protein (putative c-di-GMP-specific phosphodiesterase class I)